MGDDLHCDAVFVHVVETDWSQIFELIEETWNVLELFGI